MRGTIRIFTIILTLMPELNAPAQEDTIEVGTGWNIIGSLKTGRTSDLLRSEPANIIISPFYRYNPGAGYEAKDTLTKGVGYWVKTNDYGLIIFTSSGENNTYKLSFTDFQPDYTTDTIEVGTGWNMVGALSSGATLDIVSSIPHDIIISAFYGYNPGAGYEAKDSLKNGAGYWIKLSEDGLIIFRDATEWICGNPLGYSGKTYNTVQIGTQCWLKENLDVGMMIQGSDTAKDDGAIEKYCYDNELTNCYNYGGLYHWDEAMQYTTEEAARGICPPGWHIPTVPELMTLRTNVGEDGNALKALGQGTGEGAGTNTSGFSAILAGYRYNNGDLMGFGDIAYFWSSKESSASFAYYMRLLFDTNYIFLFYYPKDYGFSVRCLRE